MVVRQQLRRTKASAMGVGLGVPSTAMAMKTTGIGTELKQHSRSAVQAQALIFGKKNQQAMPYGEVFRYSQPLKAETIMQRALSFIIHGKNGGNGKDEKGEFGNNHLGLVPPITEAEAKDLVLYYYYGWQARKSPGDEMVKMDQVQRRPKFLKKIAAMKGEDKVRAIRLVEALKELAFEAMREMVRAKKGTDTKLAANEEKRREDIGDIELDQKKALENLDAKEKDELVSCEAFYQMKGKRLAKRIENNSKLTNIPEKLKKFIPKISIGIGAAISGLGTAFNTAKHIIKDITEHIPVISNVPPELAGVWVFGSLAGGWLLSKGLVKALIWHFEVIQSKLPNREAKRKAKVRDEFEIERKIKQWEYSEKKEAYSQYYGKIARDMQAQCEAKHQRILDGFKEDYKRQLAQTGYLSAN